MIKLLFPNSANVWMLQKNYPLKSCWQCQVIIFIFLSSFVQMIGFFIEETVMFCLKEQTDEQYQFVPLLQFFGLKMFYLKKQLEGQYQSVLLLNSFVLRLIFVQNVVFC